MDPFIAYLLIKQIKEEKTIVDQKKKNGYKELGNTCARCGQNPYWCQCQCITKDKY